MNVLSAIAAYSFFEKKPAVNIDFAIEQHSGQLTLFLKQSVFITIFSLNLLIETKECCTNLNRRVV